MDKEARDKELQKQSAINERIIKTIMAEISHKFDDDQKREEFEQRWSNDVNVAMEAYINAEHESGSNEPSIEAIMAGMSHLFDDDQEREEFKQGWRNDIAEAKKKANNNERDETTAVELSSDSSDDDDGAMIGTIEKVTRVGDHFKVTLTDVIVDIDGEEVHIKKATGDLMN